MALSLLDGTSRGPAGLEERLEAAMVALSWWRRERRGGRLRSLPALVLRGRSGAALGWRWARGPEDSSAVWCGAAGLVLCPAPSKHAAATWHMVCVLIPPAQFKHKKYSESPL